jgi:hypothetical protein
MSTRTTVVVATALLAIVTSAQSQSTHPSGNAFLPWTGTSALRLNCESKPLSFDNGDCFGYIKGVVEAHNEMLELQGRRPRICLPTKMPIRDIQNVVLNYIKNHPSDYYKPGTEVVLAALSGPWSCKVAIEK